MRLRKNNQNQNRSLMRYIALILILVVISSCNMKEKNSAQKEEAIQTEFLQKGEEIANLTQAELLKNVSHAMGTGGPVYAIEFCNLQAMHLKDSLSQIHKCEIRRIAIKYRNPLDSPKTEKEKDQLVQYQDDLKNGESLKPEVYVFEDRVEYYKPILINNAACLVCHGKVGEQIAEETLEIIKEKYPNDLATGFALNDFRGAWKITFTHE